MTEPTPQFEPLTPIETERQIRFVYNKMTLAQAELRDARKAEIEAKHTYERAKRIAVMDGDCPKVARSGHTVLDRDSWVDERCGSQREAYENARVARESAEDYLRTLFQQGTLAASLNKSVGQAYGMSGVVER